jgi:hypothetical protein
MQSKIRLSLAANTKHEMRASFQDSTTCSFIRLLYRSHTVCSSVRLVTVRIAPIASVAYLALAANTLLFRTSNLTSCRTRYHPPASIMGSDDTITTVANFQWNTSARMMQPMRLKTEIIAMAMLMPRSCCSCTGSVASRALKRPAELLG